MIGTSVHIEGMEIISEKISAQLSRILAKAGVSFTVTAGGQRGGQTNALIAAVQAKRKRNPFYLTADILSIIRGEVPGLLSASYSEQRAAQTLIEQAILASIEQNVDFQRNPDRTKFTKLTAAYAAYKKRRFGFVTPILRATGDLLDNLRVKVERER